MLASISSASRPEGKTEDAVDLLVACHQRIRYFTQMTLRLAATGGLPAMDVAAAAESVHRYFTVALPLHEADENVSLYPRLHQAASRGAVSEALEAMVQQHEDINAVLKRLLPLIQTLRDEPEKLPGVAVQITDLAQALRDLFETHLALEEDIILPAMRQALPAEDMQAILNEMRQRRA